MLVVPLLRNTALILTLSAGLFALSSSAKEPDHRLNRHAIWLDHSPRAECPTGFVKSKKEWNNLPSAVRDMSFDPSCLWDTIHMNAREHASGPIRGFTWGTFLGISAGAGYATGTELAIMKVSSDTLMVGRVKVRTAALDLTLPVGTSLTQSVLFGSCDESLFSYLGWYETFSAVAMSHSWSRKSLLPGNRERTHCDSITSTRGLTSPVIGISASYFSQLGQWVLVNGPRVRAMIEYIDDLNRDRNFSR